MLKSSRGSHLGTREKLPLSTRKASAQAQSIIELSRLSIMKEPKLTVALAERAGLPVLSISRNDNNFFNRIDWSLRTLDGLGCLGACAHIGKLTLKMLQVAHPEVFAVYPDLAPEEAIINPDDGIHYLPRASVADRTRAYLPAMDTLVQRHADALTHSFREAWPDLRARILRDYPD